MCGSQATELFVHSLAHSYPLDLNTCLLWDPTAVARHLIYITLQVENEFICQYINCTCILCHVVGHGIH